MLAPGGTDFGFNFLGLLILVPFVCEARIQILGGLSGCFKAHCPFYQALQACVVWIHTAIEEFNMYVFFHAIPKDLSQMSFVDV
jgi:hypothetical protein